MAVITTGTIPKALTLEVSAWFGRQYAEHMKEYPDLFELDTSDRAWEEIVELTGFGLVPVKDEGSAMTYDSESQGMSHRISAVTYVSGFIVTEEEQEDNLHPIVGKRRARALAFSFRQTKEIVGANVYNRAFNSSYTGGDAKELCATDHPCLSGDQSNELSTAADLSGEAVEDLVIQIHKATNSKGLNIAIKPQSLVVPADLYFEACRLYDSEMQSGTANNDVNALRLKGTFPKGVKVNHYLTDTDAWFIRTNCPESLKAYQRVPLSFKPDGDFDTGNAKYKGRERYSFGWGDFRGVYGSPGA